METNHWLWLNGVTLKIDTGALFDFIRRLPEPVPDHLTSFESCAWKLMAASSQWSVTLVEALYKILEQVYMHHPAVISNLESRGLTTTNAILEIKERCQEINAIIETAIARPISVWCNDTQDLDRIEASHELFELCDSKFLETLLMFPHIKTSKQDAEFACRKLASSVRNHEGKFNKFVKNNK